jgi:hypothetical protein
MLLLNPTNNFTLRPVTIAVQQGMPVYWKNEEHKVMRLKNGNFVISSGNGMPVNLFHDNGRDTEYSLEDFFIAWVHPTSSPKPKLSRPKGSDKVIINF